MMTQSQENWINSVVKKMPAERIDTADGPEKWRSLLVGCLPDDKLSVSLGLGSKQCLCFFGPRGSGKHTLALGYAGTVTENTYKVLDSNTRRANNYIHVTGKQLLDSGNEAAIRRVEDLFHISCEGHYVLIIEEPSELSVWETIVDECRKLENSSSITVIVVESRENVIREEWQDAMIFCRFDLPDYDERVAFFSRRFGQRIIRFPEDDILADYTEGFNYYELNAFVSLMRLKLKRILADSYSSAKEVVAAAKGGRVELAESECVKCLSMVKSGRIEHDHTPEAIHVVIDGGVMMPAVQTPAQGTFDVDGIKTVATEDLLPKETDEDMQLRMELDDKINSQMEERLRQKGLL